MSYQPSVEANIKCPHCGGEGANRGIACGPGSCQVSTFKCSTCGGSGRITPDRQAKIRAGEAMRKDRINRNQTQREEAKRLGLDVVIYSRMERGLHDGDTATPNKEQSK